MGQDSTLFVSIGKLGTFLDTSGKLPGTGKKRRDGNWEDATVEALELQRSTKKTHECTEEIIKVDFP